MVSRLLAGGAAAAVAGAAMLALSSVPSSAFTLSSPSLEKPVADAGVQQVWWDRWGRWHPNGWGWGPRWGWGWGPRPYYGFYGGGYRHCWIGRWGYRHCAWG
jgi:hypothetical protein